MANSKSFSLAPGRSHPLGATRLDDGSVNFAVFSRHATSVELCLFTDREDPTRETERIPIHEKSEEVWHVAVKGLPAGATYGFRVDGPWLPEQGHYYNANKLLLDPYARRIDGPSSHHASMVSLDISGARNNLDSGPVAPRGVVPTSDTYDWEGDTPLSIPMQECVFYETHVKGFTMKHPEVPEELRGTYAGLAHPSITEYLVSLGITSVQLMPIHQHLEDGFLLDRGLSNYWGYNTLGFFAPEAGYAASDDPVTEFRDLVKAFHRAGLEVILDVVYNHTCETGINGPTCLFRGFDNRVYYFNSPEK
ncbi:MAG: alpha-amylase family glycosyl hydrolase, partial [Verrucomicrobiota bacterium]